MCYVCRGMAGGSERLETCGSRLLEMGVDKDLALDLFERRLISMAKAAKLAGVTQDVFMDLVAEGGLVAVDYPAEELADELRVEI